VGALYECLDSRAAFISGAAEDDDYGGLPTCGAGRPLPPAPWS